MASNSRPRVSKKHGKLHIRSVVFGCFTQGISHTDCSSCSYALPHRLTCAKVYPLSAPNGSQIVIYAHETGLYTLWRGGKPLKKPSRPATLHKTVPPPRVNGAPQDVIIIDSDDEEPQPPTKKSKPKVEAAELEEEEEEYDSSHPFPAIVQSFNIRFGIEVLDIALPPIPPGSPLKLPEHYPDFFSKKLLVAATCADCSVRLVSIPLAPPSHAAKAQRHIGEEILSIGGPLHHQEHINCTSLTWTRNEESENEDDEGDMEIADAGSAKITPSKLQGAQISAQHPEWRFLIASHSTQYFGTLLIYDVPLIPDKDGGSLPDGPIRPFRNQYLKCPLTSLAFSTSHLHLETSVQLLTLDQKGSTKIYEPFTSPNTVIQSRSRTKDDHRSSGAWLTSLVPGFDTTGFSGSATAHRKHVLDAQWLLNPRAIMVLLSDGEWGIWCIQNTLSGSTPPVTGGAIAQFTMHGYLTSPDESSSSGNAKIQGLTPATPNTRKTRTADFLSGSSGKNHPIHGGIRAISIVASNGGPDERIMIWYDTRVYAIPSLRTYWQRNAPNQGDTTPSYGPNIPKVEDLELQGERCNGVEQLPGPGVPPTGLPELLVVGEHRLTFVTKEFEAPQSTPNEALIPADQDIAMDDADQTLLEREELDLGGVNRLLDGIGGSSKEPMPPRRVGFAH